MMTRHRIVVDALVDAPIEKAWEAYVTPEHIVRWNFASDDWHCPSARADLRVGGAFSSRMEAKDGSVGFDFEGTYSRIIKNELIEYTFGNRQARVEFLPMGGKILVRVTFDPEGVYPVEQQRVGWQSIIDNYVRYVSDPQ